MNKRTHIAVLLITCIALLAIPYQTQPVALHLAIANAQPQKHAALTPSDSARALNELTLDIESLITLPSEVRAGKVGVVVHSLTSNKLIFQLNGDTPLTPASTTKVVTTFTALATLGSDYMVTTDIAVTAKPKDGVVTGDVYVRGHGDPNLTVSDIDGLIEKFRAAGITRIEGNIVGDGTFFDDKFVRSEYSGDEDEVENLPPISALSVERNVYTVIVSSPRTPGEPCNVQTFPRSSGFEIINAAVSAPVRHAPTKKRRGHASLLDANSTVQSVSMAMLDDPNYPYRAGDEPLLAYHSRQKKRSMASSAKTSAMKKRSTTAKQANQKKISASLKKKTTNQSKTSTATSTRDGATAQKSSKTKTATKVATPTTISRGGSGIRVAVTGDRNGQQTIRVTGSLSANRTVSYRYEMKNPPLVVAGIVYDRLRSAGVKVTGTPTSGMAPAKCYIVASIQRPLMEILQSVMKNSNNYLAEYTFKIIGAAAGGQIETAVKSVEQIDQAMNAAKIPFGRCIINDGSGLSRANCVSTEALNGILTAAYKDSKIFPAMYSTMSIASVDGTLRRRMKGTFAEGNLRGKTGTLRNVSALAGYVTTRDGEVFSFAMLMNGGRHGEYRAVQDKIGSRIAAFSYAPAATNVSR